MRIARRRLLALAFAVGLLALLAAGCQARFDVEVNLDRKGTGELTLRLELDRAAQSFLGLEGLDSAGMEERFARFLDDGWSGGEPGRLLAISRDEDAGTLTLASEHQIASADELKRLLSRVRSLERTVPESIREEVFRGLPDLPRDAPLLNEVNFRLGDRTGDNPGFDLFARGGLGDIGEQTCQVEGLNQSGRSLRDALQIVYSFALPGGPGNTSADETPGARSIWHVRYGDCPRVSASSGGGSSSTLVNGLILAGMAGFLMIVFALRGIRRRRNRTTIVQ